MKIVTLLTDFGDFYPGVMKGVILGLCPNARIVDITHSVEPQNIYQGAFLLYHSYKYFLNAVHVAVVDPGVGTDRKAIILECRNHVFVGPDNGILIPSAKENGIERVWVIDEEKASKVTGTLSSTFHGRDVFAPSAGYACLGRIEEIAEPYDGELVEFEIYDYEIDGEWIGCRVIFVDRFGNAITNVRAEDVKNAKGFYVRNTFVPFVKSYSMVKEGEPLALIGSFDTLEFSVRNGNFSKIFGVRSGTFEFEIVR